MSAPARVPTHRADGSAVCFRNVRLVPRMAAVLGGAAITAAAALSGAGVATADSGVWDEVAQCESGGDWSIATGNGYYGGLQFSRSTWAAFGGTEFASSAHRATRAEQIAIAQRTLDQQGPGAWPVCSKRAGLTRANGGADANAQPGGRQERASRDQDRASAGALVVDGKFGPATTRALQGWVGVPQDGSLSSADIRALQSAVGATADGRIGAETTRELRAAIGLGADGTWDFRRSPSTVRALQTVLNSGAPAAVATAPAASAPSAPRSGDLVVDGKFGPATTRALQGWVGAPRDGSLSSADIRALQRTVGAVPDGKIGAETTRELRAAIGLGDDGAWDFRTSSASVTALQQFLNAR